jgi:hypothetical protein
MMKIFRKKKKKAELTSKYIITILLLVIGFGIVLLFYFSLGLGSMVNREVCHESVILRATAPDTFIGTKDYVPLKCNTRKVCITEDFFGKGDCEEFAGEEYDKARISGNKEDKERKIKMFLAREMADCWAMMGEGKVQIFTREKSDTRTCVVCSRIAFDKELKDEIGEIEGLGKYLITHKVPEKDISYWEFLTHSSRIPSQQNYDAESDVYSMDEKAIIFMEIGKGTLSGWITELAGTGTGCFLGAKIGAAIGSIVPGAGTVAGGLIGCIGGGSIGWYGGNELGKEIEDVSVLAGEFGEDDYSAGNFFIDYDVAKLKGLKCDSFRGTP